MLKDTYMSAEFSKSPDFLADHEPQVNQFIDLVHGQLDHLATERGNHGMLWMPVNDENIYAAKWQTLPPALPGNLRHLLPFKADDPVEVHARYRYGSWNGLVNVWVSNVGGDFRTFSLGLRVDPHTGQVEDSIMNHAGSNHGKDEPITESDARAVMDAIFTGNKAYQAADKNLDISSLLKLGIATQPDYGAEQYTTEVGEKSFAIPSRTKNVTYGNGFHLTARVMNRTHPQGKPSTTEVTLRRTFEPADYSPQGLYGGMLFKSLVIEQDKNNQVTSVARKSHVKLFNEPAITTVNGEQTLVSVANDADFSHESALAAHLYPNNTPTLDDLAYFARLVSTPIQEEDCYLS